MNEWMNVYCAHTWMNEWMSGWMNEQLMNEYMYYELTIYYRNLEIKAYMHKLMLAWLNVCIKIWMIACNYEWMNKNMNENKKNAWKYEWIPEKINVCIKISMNAKNINEKKIFMDTWKYE